MKRAILIALLGAALAALAPLPAPAQVIQRRGLVMAGLSRTWLGVSVTDVTADKLGALKLKEERGVEIVTVSPDSPAQQAGLKEHDVVLEFNGVRVESVEQFQRLIRETPVGRAVRLLISRDGAPQTVQAKLGERPGGRLLREPGGGFSFTMPRIEIPPIPPIPPMPDIHIFSRTGQLGIEGESLTGQLGEFFGVPGGKGVLVRSVAPNSPAEKAGLKAGDVIVKVDGESVKDIAELRSVLFDHARKGDVPVTLVRNKREMTVTVHLEHAEMGGEKV